MEKADWKQLEQHQQAELEVLLPQKTAILRTLKQWIRDGKFQDDEPLPSERVIANLFKQPRHTIRIALKDLEDTGWIERQGRNRIVTKTYQVSEFSPSSQSVVVLAQEHWSGTDHLKSGDLWMIVMGTLQALGQSPVEGTTFDPNDLSADQFMKLLSQRPKGVIAYQDTFIHTTGLSILDGIRNSGIPIVVYGYKPELNGYDTVESDQADGTYQLTQHLIERGRKRILRFWEYRADIPDNQHWLAKRDLGYQQAMKDAGFEPLPAVQFPELPFNPNTKARFDMRVRYNTGVMVEALSEYGKFDAVLAISDAATFPIACALEKLKYKPNDDVDVVGYDNYWQDHEFQQWAPFMPLATVDKHNTQIGKELVSLLLERVGGGLDKKSVHRLVKPELFVNA